MAEAALTILHEQIDAVRETFRRAEQTDYEVAIRRKVVEVTGMCVNACRLKQLQC